MKNTKSVRGGFTLIELLLVVAIIGILSAIILASLSSSKSKGKDGAIEEALLHARSQASLFYLANSNSYNNVCANTTAGNVRSAYVNLQDAASKSGVSLVRNAAGNTTTATCNDTALGWAAEVPLKAAGANQMWCVDDSGKSRMENGSSLSNSSDVTCN
ncbi:MAG TPA: type II secretion system protein [Candidatus Paceibacterota bacterium]|jgi:prepilin-type N-terminal cleavage/methylation domain-containing protein|nr:type II secretion system protein [Candidatus Paceibacterota bacterium]